MNSTIIVQNLKCGGCAKTINTHLSTIESVSGVHVDPEKNAVSFEYSEESVVTLVEEKLLQLGYPSVEDTNSITSKVKSFVSCANGKLSR